MRVHAPRLAALSLLAVAAAAAAAEPAAPPDPEPVAVVREFYRRDSVRAYEFYSARLKALLVAEAAPGEVGNLEFAFHVNGQDVEEGWQKTLRLELVSAPASEPGRAIVRVTFRNGGPQELRYAVVREGGRWVIDDVESIVPNRWVLSRILAKGR